MLLNQGVLSAGKVVAASTGPNNPGSKAPYPIPATYAYLYDATNLWALYDKAGDTQCGNEEAASIIKTITAILVYEYKSGVMTSETVTVTAADIKTGSTANLQDGDILTWEDLLHGIMVPSGNDAAYCAARIIGDEVYAAAGNTGTSGVTRFVELMNSKATALGMANSVFVSPSGVNATGNKTTTHDMCLAGAECFGTPYLAEVSMQPSWEMTITGPNARTYTVDNACAFANGPSFNQSGEVDKRVIGCKNGDLVIGASHSSVAMWQTPNGTRIVGCIIKSPSGYNRNLDMHSLYFGALNEYNYLSEGMQWADDPHLDDVVVLTGAEYGFVDESPVGRTLSNQGGVSLSTSRSMIQGREYYFDGVDGRIEAADAADLSPGSQDFCIEAWVRGDGTDPSEQYAVIASKWDATGNQKEFELVYDHVINKISAYFSLNGSTHQVIHIDVGIYFAIGRPHHIAMVRNGTKISLYVNGEKDPDDDVDVGTDALFSGTAPFMIGARASGGAGTYDGQFRGYIDEVRFTIGNARYTDDMFTVDARPFSRGDTNISTTSTSTSTTTTGSTTTTTTQSFPNLTIVAWEQTRSAVGPSSLACNFPTGTATGDEVFAFVMHSSALTSIPAGWEKITKQQNVGVTYDRWCTVFRKTYVSGDGSSVTFSQTTATGRMVVSLVTMRASDGGIIYTRDINASNGTGSSNPQSMALPSGCRGTGGEQLFIAAAWDAYALVAGNTTYTAPSSWTLQSPASVEQNRMAVATLDPATTDADASGSFTQSGGSHDFGTLVFIIGAADSADSSTTTTS